MMHSCYSLVVRLLLGHLYAGVNAAYQMYTDDINSNYHAILCGWIFTTRSMD